MKQISLACLVLAFLAMLAGCATRPAPDIKGSWKAVNHYSEAPQAIPLYQSYVFYPSPMDGTLKNMLTRWAKDSKMTLSYLHTSDFTLYRQVAEIRTANLQEAVALLNSAYTAEGISIESDDRQIVVRSSASGGAPAMPPASP